MNIWVITIDDVSDSESFRCSPIAYEKEEDARKALQLFKASIKEDYADELADGWDYDERDNWVEVYNPYNYARDHYTVMLNCVALQ